MQIGEMEIMQVKISMYLIDLIEYLDGNRNKGNRNPEAFE
jgi:hypothetical protein